VVVHAAEAGPLVVPEGQGVQALLPTPAKKLAAHAVQVGKIVEPLDE
jgi:hypothetical protein